MHSPGSAFLLPFSVFIFTVPEERDRLNGSRSNAAALLQCNETSAHRDAARPAAGTACHAPCTAHRAPCAHCPEMRSISANVPGNIPCPQTMAPFIMAGEQQACSCRTTSFPPAEIKKTAFLFFFFPKELKREIHFQKHLLQRKASTEKPPELPLYTDIYTDIISLHGTFTNKRCLALR